MAVGAICLPMTCQVERAFGNGTGAAPSLHDLMGPSDERPGLQSYGAMHHRFPQRSHTPFEPPCCPTLEKRGHRISFALAHSTAVNHNQDMADSFDLLDELGDEKKVNELKARIQQKKASDVISKLDNIESGIL